MLLPPVEEVGEHESAFILVELSGSEEPEQVVIVVLGVLSDAGFFDEVFELLQSQFLGFAHIVHEATHVRLKMHVVGR